MTRRAGARSLSSACGALLLAGLLAACGQAGVTVDPGVASRQVSKGSGSHAIRPLPPTTTGPAAAAEAATGQATGAETARGGPAPAPDVGVTKPPAPLPDGERIVRWVPVTVHFVRRAGRRLYLVPEHRLAGAGRAPVEVAAGLAVRERPVWEGSGVDAARSPVPAGTRLLGASLRGRTATIDLSREVLAWEGTPEEATYAAQALAATIASAVRLDEVRVLVEGRSGGVLDGREVAGLWDGLGVATPVRPDSGTRRAPVSLSFPRPNATVEGGHVWVQGEASTGQGVVSLRLRDAGGEVVAQTFTTAERRAPARGAFSTSLGFTPPPTEATWTLEVFETDPDDGTPTYQVAVPLRVGA